LFRLEIDREGQYTFRAGWKRPTHERTEANLYDGTRGTVERTPAGQVIAIWHRSSIVGLTPPGVLGGIVRVASQAAAQTEFSELEKLHIRLNIEGHTLQTSTGQLTKTQTHVTFSAAWDGQKVAVRIGLEDFPTPKQVNGQS
jgi:hypothetical protein